MSTGSDRHSARPGRTRLAVVSRLERAGAGAGRGAGRRGGRAGAAARQLDHHVHGAAAGFILQFFPLFLLGAVFGKLMEDSGSVAAIARWMTVRLGPQRAMLAVVLAGAVVTYGGVSLFVAFFVLVPMAQALFRAADIPNRLMPAAIALGTMTFTMSALPGTPAIQNAIPMPFFGTTPFAAPGLGSSRRPSCWASACGGSPRGGAARGARARDSAMRSRPPRRPRMTIRRCASARRPRARSTRRRSSHGHPERGGPGAVHRRAAARGGDRRQSRRVAAGAAAPRPRLSRRASAGAAPAAASVTGVWSVLRGAAAAIVALVALTVGGCLRCANGRRRRYRVGAARR